MSLSVIALLIGGMGVRGILEIDVNSRLQFCKRRNFAGLGRSHASNLGQDNPGSVQSHPSSCLSVDIAGVAFEFK